MTAPERKAEPLVSWWISFSAPIDKAIRDSDIESVLSWGDVYAQKINAFLTERQLGYSDGGGGGMGEIDIYGFFHREVANPEQYRDDFVKMLREIRIPQDATLKIGDLKRHVYIH